MERIPERDAVSMNYEGPDGRLDLAILKQTGLDRRKLQTRPVPIQLQSTQTQDVKLGRLSFPKKGSVKCQTRIQRLDAEMTGTDGLGDCELWLNSS